MMTFLFLNKNQLGIFSADIDDRPDLWIKMLNSFSLGDDLIDEIPAQQFGDKLPSDSCKRKSTELFGGNPLKDLFQYF
jgi:hypothetical protein